MGNRYATVSKCHLQCSSSKSFIKLSQREAIASLFFINFCIFATMMFKWLTLITGICYVVLGVFVIIYKFFVITLETNIAYMLGALLILYGFFRIGRMLYRIRQDKNEL